MAEQAKDCMPNIVMVIKFTDYLYDMKARGYDYDGMKKQLDLCWNLVLRERGVK